MKKNLIYLQTRYGMRKEKKHSGKHARSPFSPLTKLHLLLLNIVAFLIHFFSISGIAPFQRKNRGPDVYIIVNIAYYFLLMRWEIIDKNNIRLKKLSFAPLLEHLLRWFFHNHRYCSDALKSSFYDPAYFIVEEMGGMISFL